MLDIFKGIIDRALRPERAATLDAAGRTYVYSDAAQKYEPQTAADTSDHAPGVTLADAVSLIDWCKAIGARITTMVDERDDAIGQVVISRTGATLALTPIFCLPHVARECGTKKFYMGFMPHEQFAATLGYEDILTWLELLGDRVEGAEALGLAFRSVSAADGRKATIEQDGAVIKVRAEMESGVKASGQLPKRIRALIPFGDPECEVPVEFGLRVTADKDGTLHFALRHLISDGAFDSYAAWMRERLMALPVGWLVLVGP